MRTLLLIAILFLSGCSSSDKPAGPNADSTEAPPSTPGDASEPEESDSIPTPPDDSTAEPDIPMTRKWIAAGHTYQQPDGNRLALGTGSLPGGTELEIRLSGTPQWVVAAPIPEGSIWAVVLTDGRVQAFRIAANQTEPLTIAPNALAPGTPPLLLIDDQGQPALANPSDENASISTHPALLTPEGRIAYIDNSGDLVIRDGDVDLHLPVNALPDARVLVDENERILLLTDPTGRYGHGVLGDDLEAAGIALIETRPTPQIILHIDIPAPAVVEGLSPIWADLTGDGQREILVTLSDEQQGARIAAFDETGRQIATGPAIGQGYRWRHQIAVAPFGPLGEIEIVDVLTPHIGGTVEFYTLVDDALDIAARMPGYTSHRIGSRNLDMAVAGDFDGDGQTELLLPNQALTELGAVRHTQTGARIVWTLPLNQRISTNLATVTLDDDRLAIGLGYGQTLHLWLP
jgi:hypothetical protein